MWRKEEGLRWAECQRQCDSERKTHGGLGEGDITLRTQSFDRNGWPVDESVARGSLTRFLFQNPITSPQPWPTRMFGTPARAPTARAAGNGMLLLP